MGWAAWTGAARRHGPRPRRDWPVAVAQSPPGVPQCEQQAPVAIDLTQMLALVAQQLLVVLEAW